MGSTAAEHSENLEYVQGYVPVSLTAPHSSLNKTITWQAMSMILASTATLGTFVYGLAIYLWPSSASQTVPGTFYMTLGIVGTLIFWALGAIMIKIGRRNYHAYSKRTGRHH